MTTTFALTTLVELIVGITLVYGFMHEDKMIAFEQTIKRIVIGNIRRCIRKYNERKIDKAIIKLMNYSRKENN